MKRTLFLISAGLMSLAAMGSKDKTIKVPYQEMALGMRDAFNCGLVVEKKMHGSLKDKEDEYQKLRQMSNCDHVEAVLNTLNDGAETAPAPH